MKLNPDEEMEVQPMLGLARVAAVAAFAIPCLSCAADAHPGMGHLGVLAGFAHPLSGIDHILAMVAVGAPGDWVEGHRFETSTYER
jgi:hydrogenase/urease accessory protein HupE